MLLFQKRFHEGLVSGAVRLTFRRWKKPHVKVGGRYRCHPIGVLEVDRVELVSVANITVADASSSGFDSREALLDYMKTASEEPLEVDSDVYRIELHYGGDGDRVTVALDDKLSPEDVGVLRKKLARLDEKGPWTKKTLAIIEAEPRVAASKLAAKLKRDKLEFKEDVRKLKRLGLTQSFEVGYELSPRGKAYLAATRKPARPKK
ncbi:MAG: hypothetical protein HOW73_42035 [Polyangiaceae bacterium]|nr:hypothetical protein [Polyangiaceae bacterium]